MKINPELQTFLVDLEKLQQDPANVREHSPKNMEAICASLDKFGQQKPIVVNDKGIILAGNGTYAAAKQLGWKSIAVLKTDLNDEVAQKAYAIADNRTNDLSVFNDELLKTSLEYLQEQDFDIESTGFDFGDLAALDWDSDIDKMDRIEENDEGVPCRIVVECPQEEEAEMRSFLEEKLKEISIVAKLK